MGAFLSVQKRLAPQNARSYSDKSRISKELGDTILKIFFENADFRDILSLSSMSQCPRYVFTTGQALQTLFHTIQVYPKLGKAGEILYAPITELSPGISGIGTVKKNSEKSSEELARERLRNQMCMDVAYFYVRIFQIYGALALTVLDTDPTRRRVQFLPQQRQGLFQSQIAKPTYKQSAFFKQGGALPARDSIRKEMSKVAFAPLTDYVSVALQQKDIVFLTLDNKDTTTKFFIEWVAREAQRPQADLEMDLKGTYRKGGKKESFKITMNANGERPISGAYPDQTIITMYIDQEEIQKFIKNISNWEFIYENDEQSDDPRPFYEKLRKYFSEGEEVQGKAGVVRRVSSVQGKSAFEGLEQLKKLYDDKRTKGDFPKAYCIARAMTLLNPIFDSERLDKRQPYYSQICKNTFDFETVGELMPRFGKTASANIYFRSFVSLYYDDYEIRSGEVVFKKTSEGNQQLQNASKKIAGLHNIESNAEKFLESNATFKKFKLCLMKDSSGKELSSTDVSIELRDMNLVNQLLKEVVVPMLTFQEQHTAKVNEIFKKMFIVSTDKQGRASMSFSDILHKGGRESVNTFGIEARNLLLNYYLTSEAYFIKGVQLIERNSEKITKV